MSNQNIHDKKNIRQEIIGFFNLFKFKNIPILLMGSAGLKSSIYSADFDLITYIDKKYIDELFIFINDLIIDMKKADSAFINVFFIELKIQMKDGTKYKFYKFNQINFDKYKVDDIDFIKIDVVINDDFILKELSIIYKIINENDKEEDINKLIKIINDDRLELIKDKKYFKSLKRLVSILLLINKDRQVIDNTVIYNLMDFINSPIGKTYQIISNLKTLDLLEDNLYKFNKSRQNYIKNLIDGNQKILIGDNERDNYIKLNEAIINNKAKKLLSLIKK